MKSGKETKLPLAGFQLRRLTLQLFVSIVLPLTLLLLAIVFISLSLHQNAMRELVGIRDERITQILAAALDEQLQFRTKQLEGLFTQFNNELSPQDFQYYTEQLDAYLDGGIAIVDPQGNPLFSSIDETLTGGLPTDGTVASQKSGQELYTIVIQTTSGAMQNSKGLILLTLQDNSDGTMLVGAFSLTNIMETLLNKTTLIDQQQNIFLVDKQTFLYATTNTNPIYGIDTLILKEMINADQTGSKYITVDRDDHIFAYSPVPGTSWTLITEEPWKTASTPFLTITQITPLILIPILLLALVSLWFGAKQIVKPLQSLEDKTMALAWGNFEVIKEPVGGIEEIQHLQTEMIYLAGKVKSAQESLHGYIGAITSGQEEERSRIARELHDDTLQTLIALNQRLQLLKRSTHNSGNNTESIEELQALTEQTIQDLRRITRGLRPLYLEDLGLVAALEMLSKEYQQTTGIKIDFLCSGDEKRMSNEIELAFYRIAQEGLSNISRHANATESSLQLDFFDNKVMMTIKDNGLGFIPPASPAEFAPLGHFGLLGIHERTELIGAKLKIIASPDAGTELIITLPLS